MGITVSRSGLIAAVSLTVLLAACGGGNSSGTSADAAGGGSASQGGGAQTPTAGGTETPTSGGAGQTSSSGGAGQSTAGGGTTPVANAKPTITGNPPAAVAANSPYAFVPKAIDADGNVLTFKIANAPSWATFDAATGKLSGTPDASQVGTYGNISISVTDGAADASLGAFSISVQPVGDKSVELSWQAPTENEDGSALTDLAGFKVYWGTSPGEYPKSVAIDNPSVLTYVLGNLVPNTYYFVTTAVNTEGNESAPSAMARATIG